MKIMSLKHILYVLTIIFVPLTAAEDICEGNKSYNIQSFYLQPSKELASNILPIFACHEEQFKDPKNRGQFISIVGGVMQKHPEYIEAIIESSNDVNVTVKMKYQGQTVQSSIAPQIILDALWFCSTEPCQKRLLQRPFNMPKQNIDRLLSETPPNPLTIPINHPAVLDFLWGYFFATGNEKVPERILNEAILVKNNGEENTISILIKGSAQWSFLSLARVHSIIKAQLVEKSKTSEDAKKLLDKLLEDEKSKTK